MNKVQHKIKIKRTLFDAQRRSWMIGFFKAWTLFFEGWEDAWEVIENLSWMLSKFEAKTPLFSLSLGYLMKLSLFEWFSLLIHFSSFSFNSPPLNKLHNGWRWRFDHWRGWTTHWSGKISIGKVQKISHYSLSRASSRLDFLWSWLHLSMSWLDFFMSRSSHRAWKTILYFVRPSRLGSSLSRLACVSSHF